MSNCQNKPKKTVINAKSLKQFGGHHVVTASLKRIEQLKKYRQTLDNSVMSATIKCRICSKNLKRKNDMWVMFIYNGFATLPRHEFCCWDCAYEHQLEVRSYFGQINM